MIQNEIIIHQVENYETTRKKYLNRVLIKDKLPHLNSKLQIEYSNDLNITENTEPYIFLLYKNPALNLKHKKNFTAI